MPTSGPARTEKSRINLCYLRFLLLTIEKTCTNRLPLAEWGKSFQKFRSGIADQDRGWHSLALKTVNTITSKRSVSRPTEYRLAIGDIVPILRWAGSKRKSLQSLTAFWSD